MSLGLSFLLHKMEVFGPDSGPPLTFATLGRKAQREITVPINLVAAPFVSVPNPEGFHKRA